ncbi:hypothetical protein [Streptomyces sp. NPDC054794]
MNETLPEALPAERTVLETSDDNAWQSPGYTVVETALEVTAYALGDLPGAGGSARAGATPAPAARRPAP